MKLAATQHEKDDVTRFNATNGRVDKIVWQMSVIILIGGLVLGLGKDYIASKLFNTVHAEAKEK